MISFPRIPGRGDFPGMKKLWREVFGDPDDFIDAFFDYWVTPELSLVTGECESAGFLLDFGTYLDKKCAMIYAVATAPEKRGLGFASTLVRALSRRAAELGFDFTCLSPASQSLFGYYETHTDQRTCFYCRRFDLAPCHSGLTAEFITPEEYYILREPLFGALPHIKMNEKALKWFELSGGRFLKISDRACAAAEMQEGELFIRELISPEQSPREAAAAVLSIMGGSVCHVTAPDFDGERSIRHGTADISMPDAFLGLTFE